MRSLESQFALRFSPDVDGVAMRLYTLIGLLVIGVCFCVDAAAVAADASASPFKITTKHATDKVTVELQAGVATFAIRSPGGIGRAVIERQAAKWPDKITLRLYLRGLESFRISNGKSTLHVAIASHGEPPRIRVWKDDQENAPLTPNDPAWIAVRILDKQNRPTTDMPLADGTFELTLPGSLFADAPQSITLDWIDFYRN